MVAISSIILIRLAIAAGLEAALFISNKNERAASAGRRPAAS